MENDMKKKSLRLLYFAMLRESTGVRAEDFSTTAGTPKELYAELRDLRGFAIGEADLRVAVNGEFAYLDDNLSEGDEIAFIPPVSGG